LGWYAMVRALPSMLGLAALGGTLWLAAEAREPSPRMSTRALEDEGLRLSFADAEVKLGDPLF